MSEFVPSKYQQAIFDWLLHGEGSAIVDAVAGAGKTTTIEKTILLAPETMRVQYIAFNKPIVEEAKKRLPRRIGVNTYHSFCLAQWRKVSRRFEIESRKIFKIIDQVLGPVQRRQYGTGVAKLVSIARGYGIVPEEIPDTFAPIRPMQDTEEAWMRLVDHFEIEFGDDENAELTDPRIGIRYARTVLTQSIRLAEQVIDFDDMLYMPVISGAPFDKFDLVCGDEQQDTNPIQLEALKRMLTPEGRFLGCGDERQAIYGFRGADSDSMNMVARAFNCKRFPLSISYRCPRAVVALAQHYVEGIESAPDAPEGAVRYLAQWSARDFEPTDVILCRNNGPLVETAYNLISQGVGCFVLGREIGTGLVKLVKKLNAQGIDRLLVKLEEYQTRENEKLVAKGEETKAEALSDRCSCIRVVISHLKETERTVPALIQHLETLFADKGQVGRLMLSTVHKAKGKEWPRVFILNREELMPSRWARQPWQQIQERNLIYVAVTRAKQELVDITTQGYTIAVQPTSETGS